MKTELDRTIRARVQEEAGRQVRLEALAYELDAWLQERGVSLLYGESVRLSDNKTYLELYDISSFNNIRGVDQ